MAKLEYTNWPRPWGTSDNIAVVGRDDVKVWAGTLTLYAAASGYYYESGEQNIKPIESDGESEIRIPDLSVVHQVRLSPRNPRFNCAPFHESSGVDPYCMSGRPYNVVKVKWLDVTSGDTAHFVSMTSGELDVLAVGK